MDTVDVIKEILITKIYVEADPDDIAPEHHFHRDLGVDSLGFVELRVQVEERFDIAVTDEEFNPENFMSLETLSAFIERNRAGARTGRPAEPDRDRAP